MKELRNGVIIYKIYGPIAGFDLSVATTNA